MAPEPGSRLGHYDVTSLLGEGGMGQGYMPQPTGDLPRLALHDFALTMLGVHLLDRADFDALAEAAAVRNRWEFMLTIGLLPIPNGTGSPVNPIAIF